MLNHYCLCNWEIGCGWHNGPKHILTTSTWPVGCHFVFEIRIFWLDYCYQWLSMSWKCLGVGHYYWASFHNPSKIVVIHSACGPFPTTFFPPCQHCSNVLGYSALNTAPFFSHDLLCLTLLVWGVSDHLLNNHQDCSHPHDCVAPLNQAEGPLEAQETFGDVSGSLANWRVIP